MEEQKKVKRIFSPEQKANIVHQIETDIKSGISTQSAVDKQGVGYSSYAKWRKQLSVGIKSSLRNGKLPVDKQRKQLERKVARLETLVLSQAQAILKRKS